MCEEKLSVFSGAYWRTARNELKNPRVLAFAGLVCAISIVLESLPIYLMGPSLKIYFSFLAVSLGCMCYGPVTGMMAGAIIDSAGGLRRAVFPRLPDLGCAVGSDLRRHALPAKAHAAARHHHTAHH